MRATVPDHCIRCRSSLDQASFSGLTSFTTISRALDEFSDFNWASVIRTYRADWDAYIAALPHCTEFAGFARVVDPRIRAQLVSTLAYVVAHFLVKTGVQPSLSQAGCFKVSVIRGKVTLDAEIRAYANKAINYGELNAAENAALLNISRRIRNLGEIEVEEEDDGPPVE